MTETQNQMIDLNVRYARELKNPQPQDVEFLFIRHGQHVGDTDERIEGWADFELTKRGIEQSTLLANHLKEHKVKINHLYTSTLKRATVTANIVGEAIGLKPIPLNGLRAMNYGLPGGLKIFKSSIIFPKPKDLKAPHQKSWKSESEIDFSSRVLSTFYELYYSHPGETIAVVTHGRVISTIFRELMNLPFTHDFRVQSDDTSILHVKFSPKQTIIYSVNNTDHLKSASLLSDSDE